MTELKRDSRWQQMSLSGRRTSKVKGSALLMLVIRCQPASRLPTNRGLPIPHTDGQGGTSKGGTGGAHQAVDGECFERAPSLPCLKRPLGSPAVLQRCKKHGEDGEMKREQVFVCRLLCGGRLPAGLWESRE
ncbi:hypothetical protein DPEC_G00075540 [Dallia pectoralis]|uniref:Uncharacterized protein n=1 Tax=Dallia pectoralis TaxID=75939 RepID=A0ACC2H3Z5_DALPE|nr:hypothetical protein DPEC_G00075540 [Dallia pectoralis]